QARGGGTDRARVRCRHVSARLLPDPARADCRAGRRAVSPRRVQPVPVESVLEKAPVGTDAFVRPSRAQLGPLFASLHPKGSSWPYTFWGLQRLAATCDNCCIRWNSHSLTSAGSLSQFFACAITV